MENVSASVTLTSLSPGGPAHGGISIPRELRPVKGFLGGVRVFDGARDPHRGVSLGAVP